MASLYERLGFIRTAEFALSFSCGLTALAFGSDHVLLWSALGIGWFLAALGVISHPTLNLGAKCKWSVLALTGFFVEGTLLYWHAHFQSMGQIVGALLDHPIFLWIALMMLVFGLGSFVGRSLYPQSFTGEPPQAPSGTDSGRSKDEVQTRNRRRSLISSGRAIVNSSASQQEDSATFKKRLETETVYLTLRPHLSPEFRNLTDPGPAMGRTVVVVPDGPSPICWLAQKFLDELERLEREWKVG